MVSFKYENRLLWTGGKQGVLHADGKDDLRVATPPEFKGVAGIWSPEDLLVGAVNACVMSTFLAFAEREGLQLFSYESSSVGRLAPVERVFQITEVEVAVTGCVDEKDFETALRLSERVEPACFISNSIKANVLIHWTIDRKRVDSALASANHRGES
jgi:organic hydroperoxide reductase OsmC/OhrA